MRLFLLPLSPSLLFRYLMDLFFFSISRTTHEQVFNPKIAFSKTIDAALSDSENTWVYVSACR